MNIRHLAVCFLIITTLSACGGNVFNNFSDFDLDRKGISYFLPKTLIKVKLTPLGYKATTPVVQLTPNQKAAATTNGAIRIPVTIDRRHYRVRVDEGGKLVDNLVIGLNLDLGTYGGAPTKEHKQIADPDHQYMLDYNSSVFSSDKVCAGIKDGMLDFVQASTKDETGRIAIAIAQLAGRVIGPNPFAVDVGPEALGMKPVEVEIDPLNTDDWKAVNRAIRVHFPSLRDDYRFSVPNYAALLDDGTESLCSDDVICYRTMVPVRLELQSPNGHVLDVVYATVANQKRTNSANITRAFLVEKVTTLDFEEGVLKEMKISKPSEALEVAKLPLTLYDTLLTSILSAPKEFISDAMPFNNAKELQDAVSSLNTHLTQVNTLRTNLKALRNEGLDAAGLTPIAFDCN